MYDKVFLVQRIAKTLFTRVDVRDIDQNTFDLSVKNPNKKEEIALRPPQMILEEMKALDAESAEILSSISELI